MTCRHGPYDPNCGSYSGNIIRLKRDYREQILDEVKANTPDAANFEIEEVEQVNDHLVLRVKYPNCATCSYEGSKVMVFLNTSMKDALKWRTIDPHFREPGNHTPKEAPSPDARFPGSPEGWRDAMSYTSYIGARVRKGNLNG